MRTKYNNHYGLNNNINRKSIRLCNEQKDLNFGKEQYIQMSSKNCAGSGYGLDLDLLRACFFFFFFFGFYLQLPRKQPFQIGNKVCPNIWLQPQRSSLRALQ
jgi:hypothetical protein